jgi:hypothetical protein
MSDDSYHSIGARQDRARLYAMVERIAVALERIASELEAQGGAVTPPAKPPA